MAQILNILYLHLIKTKYVKTNWDKDMEKIKPKMK